MTRRAMTSAALALGLVLWTGGTATAQQQGAARSIDPGMTADQVRQVLGTPLYESSYGDHTYFFYDNGCEKECGFLDLVIFQSDQVVDAVFRAPWHEYTGESSSPRGVTPRPTPGGERLQVPEGQVEGVEVRPAGPPPDTVPPPRTGA